MQSVCRQSACRCVIRYFGHIARRDADNLDPLMVIEKVVRKRPRCRSPKQWSNQIPEQLEFFVSAALHQATGCNRWRYNGQVAVELRSSAMWKRLRRIRGSNVACFSGEKKLLQFRSILKFINFNSYRFTHTTNFNFVLARTLLEPAICSFRNLYQILLIFF